MSRRDWIIALICAALVALSAWRHEQWHDLNTRTAALAAKAEAYAEMCRAIKGSRP